MGVEANQVVFQRERAMEQAAMQMEQARRQMEQARINEALSENMRLKIERIRIVEDGVVSLNENGF